MPSPPTSFRRRQRHESGFWSSPPPCAGARYNVKSLAWPSFGADVELGLTSNLLCRSDDIAYRDGYALFRPAGSAQVCSYAAFSLTQSRGVPVDDINYVNRMDEISQSTYDFAVWLSTGFGPLEALFELGRTVVHMERLEVLPRSKFRGKGVALGNELMKHLRSRYGAFLFLFKPFPLEYEAMGGEQGPALDSLEAHPGFVSARAALMRLYSRGWGAEPLQGAGEDYMFCSPRLALKPRGNSRPGR